MKSIVMAGAHVAVICLVSPGCIGPLDTFGNETIVTEEEELSKDDQLQDDKIEDKNPLYDPDRVVEEQFGPCTVRLNKSKTVTRLDIVPFAEQEADLEGKLFAGRGEALAGLQGGADLIPSMEVVNGKLKPFNDGLYAAIESDLQQGQNGLAPGKRQFLYDLLDALAERAPDAGPRGAALLDHARAFVAASLLAGGNPVDVPAEVDQAAREALDMFHTDPQRGRPVGFYTWNELLEEVFVQDRFLQNLDLGLDPQQAERFGFGIFAAMAAVLADDTDLLERYQQIHALYAGLTNPYASYSPLEIMPYLDGLASLEDIDVIEAAFVEENPSLMTCSRASYALLPSSRSKDTEFFNSRWCSSGMPEGVSFIDVLIDAIRSGDLDLAPDPDAGWYDYQLWALETLLLPERGPESDHLLLTAAYKQKLIDTFKSLITQARETHVKQLQGGFAGTAMEEPEIDIYPLFPVEPFPTFYLRTARGYRFLQTYLEAVLGPDYLAAAGRLHEDGARDERPLEDEFASTIDLLYGLYILSARSVGLDPDAHLLAEETAAVDLEAGIQAARAWLEGWQTDPDVLSDPRVIVPVSVDDGSGRGVYWAVLGVKAVKARAEFVEGYEPEVLGAEDKHGQSCLVRDILPRDYLLLVEHMEEVRFSGPPPTRDEFRAVCDRHDNPADIVADLENGL